jgi:hypothetical protein
MNSVPRTVADERFQKSLLERWFGGFILMKMSGVGWMGRQPRFFDMADRLLELSAKGDDLERNAGLVDFDMFRTELERAVPRSDGTKGGRPALTMC